ncbi:MAG: chemotaxis protein CheW [Gammaproteobacteria bacterium]|nr:chemotaxis protein CheW [Gammaproteobacteria bacterium]MDH5652162.1 chemotaxis protein CheW [Gammaproteobacteria bacterium]
MSQSNLALQSEAISLYLDSLLKDVPDGEEAEQATAVDEKTIAAPATPASSEDAGKLHDGVVKTPPMETAITPPPGGKPSLPQQPDAIIPDWANGPFQAMLFKVGELSLALPLSELTGVVEWKGIDRQPGMPGAQLGTYQYNGKSVPVMDMAQLVLPPTMLEDLVGSKPAERISRIVLIQEGQWGLACDSVHELITLQPENIRWHTARTRRQWLAGTSIELMCALIDTRGLVLLLEAAKQD